MRTNAARCRGSRSIQDVKASKISGVVSPSRRMHQSAASTETLAKYELDINCPPHRHVRLTCSNSARARPGNFVITTWEAAQAALTRLNRINQSSSFQPSQTEVKAISRQLGFPQSGQLWGKDALRKLADFLKQEYLGGSGIQLCGRFVEGYSVKPHRGRRFQFLSPVGDDPIEHLIGRYGFR